MASSMIEYLDEYGDYVFSKRPFCVSDSIVLSQLCYFKFDGLIPGTGYIYLRDLNDEDSISRMLEDPKYSKPNRELFDRLVRSKRFHALKLSHYVSVTDKTLQTQFCAVTFSLPGGISFVAYRGTDETLVGWKEDFNLTYMDEVPAQHLAVEYLEASSELIPGRFYVGGHSKGGHLSIYASMHVSDKIQDRLIKIYCLDGPGFRKSMLKEDGYERIRDRVEKLIPQSGLIGMLQQQDDNYTVIKSTGVGLLQHNLYTWQIEHGEPVPEGELKGKARIVDSAVNEWIENLDTESRQHFVDSLYEIFTGCDVDNRIDFMSDFVKNTRHVISLLKDTDDETTAMLKSVTGQLFEYAAVSFRTELGLKDAGQIEAWIRKHSPHRGKKKG